MKILLVGINAKYVQTNLAIRLLKAFAEEHIESVKNQRIRIETGEWNINQPAGAIVRDIYESAADVILFSTYIWNREMILRVTEDVRNVMPKAIIGAGGPEVSWSAEKTLHCSPAIDFVISGEGELTFAEVIERIALLLPEGNISRTLDAGADFLGIPGLYVRLPLKAGQLEAIQFGGERLLIENLDMVPFPYTPERLDFDPSHRLVYYETSRGCPFSCAYCLSSIEKKVRYYPLPRVLNEIAYFMESGFPLVKFVDRTFNLEPERYLAIWKYIRDRYNGKTLFHFEISAEYLSDEAFAVLDTMPEGSVQFEIGIQSINPETLKKVGRPAHPEKLAEKIRRIPRSIHTHLDLIAGLPAENLDSFSRSFDYAFALDADMLQLGFLKILSGSPMEKMASETNGYRWSSRPPYEVFSSPVLSYADLLLLKDVDLVVDSWYNTGLMKNTLHFLAGIDGARTAFNLFRTLAVFMASYYPDGDLFFPRKPADSFACMAKFIQNDLALCDDKSAGTGTCALEYLKYDFLLQGKPGAFPGWYERRYSKEDHDAALKANGLLQSMSSAEHVSRRTVYARTEYDRFLFNANMGEESFLFVYSDIPGEKKPRCVRL